VALCGLAFLRRDDNLFWTSIGRIAVRRGRVSEQEDDERQEPKPWENRLRRQAIRQGLRLVKYRNRDPDVFNYGKYYVVNLEINGIIEGCPLGLTLEQAESKLATLATESRSINS
jgi:hypothetical protein